MLQGRYQAKEVIAFIAFVAQHDFIFVMAAMTQLAEESVYVLRYPDCGLTDVP